MKIQFRC